jgi:hypothetical protein
LLTENANHDAPCFAGGLILLAALHFRPTRRS